MKESCESFQNLLPCYALDALDPDEVKALQAHLRSCADCQAVLEEYRTVSNGLLFAMPRQSPPPRVRARLIARLAPDKAQAASRRTGRVWSAWQWAMGLALAALVALNVSTLAQLNAVQRSQATLTEELYTNQKALSLVAYPQSRTFTVSGQATGTLVLNSELASGVLFAWGLEPLDAAHTYQVWLIQPDGKRVSGGLFRPEPDESFVSAFISLPQPLSEFVGMGVTVEPLGGSPGPTTPRVIGATF
jgi:anti-sigma-K factor RskA